MVLASGDVPQWNGTTWVNKTAADLVPSGTYMPPPDLLGKVIYVTPQGDDANTGQHIGLGSKGAKLTLQGAKAALGGAPGKVVMGRGEFSLGNGSSGVTFDQVGQVLDGDGYGTTIVVDTAITGDILKFTDGGGRFVARDFRILMRTGGSAARALHITRASASNETVNVYGVFVQVDGGTLTDGIVVGGDTSGDVSEVNFFGCRSAGATNAAWKVGNGTAGNVLDIRMYGCDGRSSAYGLEIDGSAANWIGGSLLGNTSADVKVRGPATAPISIQDVRSEGSKRFWECSTNGTAAYMMSMRNISVSSFTDAAGVVVQHSTSHGLSMEDCRFSGGPVAVAMTISAPSSNPMPFFAKNVVTDADSPFGALSNVVATIINLRKVEAGTNKMVSVSAGNITQLGETVNVAALQIGGTAVGIGFAFPHTGHPMILGAGSVTTANRCYYQRARGGSPSVSNIGIHVVVSSGNICVGVLSGPAGRSTPTTTVATSGSVPCPAAGFASVALGSTVAMPPDTSWFALGADNTTATFALAVTAAATVSALAKGISGFATSFPIPSPPAAFDAFVPAHHMIGL